MRPRLLPDAEGWAERKPFDDVEDVPEACR
jgi:hypothetical protein